MTRKSSLGNVRAETECSSHRHQGQQPPSTVRTSWLRSIQLPKAPPNMTGVCVCSEASRRHHGLSQRDGKLQLFPSMSAHHPLLMLADNTRVSSDIMPYIPGAQAASGSGTPAACELPSQSCAGARQWQTGERAVRADEKPCSLRHHMQTECRDDAHGRLQIMHTNACPSPLLVQKHIIFNTLYFHTHGGSYTCTCKCEIYMPCCRATVVHLIGGCSGGDLPLMHTEYMAGHTVHVSTPKTKQRRSGQRDVAPVWLFPTCGCFPCVVSAPICHQA